jgi:uncharacterized Zn finger protein
MTENKCLCGGCLKYYHGGLGYEAMKCLKCGFMWDGINPEEHEEQKKAYILVLKHTLSYDDFKKLNIEEKTK